MSLHNDLSTICSELRSKKHPTRNKAAEKLDAILVSSKNEIIALFQARQDDPGFITFVNLFNSAVEATVQHATQLEEMQNSRTMQQMRNKNYIYRSIVEKLIHYNLEENNAFLSKSTILKAFSESIDIPSVVIHFTTLFLFLLDRGIYRSPQNVQELKVNEFSRILSYLFQFNMGQLDSEAQRDVLRTINRTIELATQQVHIHDDLVSYLPQLHGYAFDLKDERRRAEVIRMFHSYVSELSLDYHHTVGMEMRRLLPLVAGFYSFRMPNETKETLFHAFDLLLNAHVNADVLNECGLPLAGEWLHSLQCLQTIVEVEIREQNLTHARSMQALVGNCMQHFVRMASRVEYLLNWHSAVWDEVEVTADPHSSRRKIAKPADKLELIMDRIFTAETKFNRIWLAILAELVMTHDTVVNGSNVGALLQLSQRVLPLFADAVNLSNIRKCLLAVLRHEKQLVLAGAIKPLDWSRIVEFLIADTTAADAAMLEKHQLLQALVVGGKVPHGPSVALLQVLISSPGMRRGECIETIRQIFIHADLCGLEKTGELVGRVISWLHEPSGTRLDARSALLNIAPIEPGLLADVSAVAVINFLNAKQVFAPAFGGQEDATKGGDDTRQMLLYKHNRQFGCLEGHGRTVGPLNRSNSASTPSASADDDRDEASQANCLFQANYELLMRLLNFEPSQKTECRDICADLGLLLKMATLMRTLLEYGVFSADNYAHCPLIKRIGFFLSHLEFQLKSQKVEACHRGDLSDVLQRLVGTFGIFTSNAILLKYLESQPLEELVTFVGNTLTYSRAQHAKCRNRDDDAGDRAAWSGVTALSLRMLATLCASDSHFDDAFPHIPEQALNIEGDLPVLLELIRVFCGHRNPKEKVTDWFLERLECVFLEHFRNIAIITTVVDMLPAIFRYVQVLEEPLNMMLCALNSLLMVSYKKSYPRPLTVRLINSIHSIIQECRGIGANVNFSNICLSVVKFLPFPSFHVQMATVNAMSGMVDDRWRSEGVPPSSHLEFARRIYDLVRLEELPEGTVDLIQNRTAVTVQSLVALFVFSACFHRRALQELMFFCHDHSLTAVELVSFADIAQYFGCSLEQLMRPFVAELIVAWVSRGLPIAKFPYYLCERSLAVFITLHIRQIVVTQLLYGKAADMGVLLQYKSQDELVKLALPVARALLLVRSAGCPEAEESSEYERHMQRLRANLRSFGSDVPPQAASADAGLADREDWLTLDYLFSRLHDEEHIAALARIHVFHQPAEWQSLSADSLRKCLACLVLPPKRSASSNFFAALVAGGSSLLLLRALGVMKAAVVECPIATDAVQYLSVLCAVVDMLLDQLPPTAALSDAVSNELDLVQNLARLIVRDTLSFAVLCLRQAGEWRMQQAALGWLRHFLSKSVVSSGFCASVIHGDINDIFKALERAAESPLTAAVDTTAIELMRQLLSEHKAHLTLLDEFPEDEKFDCLRSLQRGQQKEQAPQTDLGVTIRSFLGASNRGVKGIRAVRNLIARNKSQLAANNEAAYALIKRLLELVRADPSKQVRLEAMRGLGEIGALHIEGFAYCFQTDTSLYEDDSAAEAFDVPMARFARAVMGAVEKLLRHFDANTYEALLLLAEMLINSKHGKQLMDEFPVLIIFKTNQPTNSFGSSAASPGGFIDWARAIRSAEAATYEHWLRRFVASLLSDCGWTELQRLAELESVFAEAVLVPLIKLLLRGDDNARKQHITALSVVLDEFFAEFVVSQKAGGPHNGRRLFREKRIISKMLSICECIRTHNNWQVPVNILNVVEACNYCQAYFMSIIYLELWASMERTAAPREQGQPMLSNGKLRARDSFQSLAKKAYESIGCRDAIAGFMDPLKSRVSFLELKNCWADVLLAATGDDIVADGLYTDILRRNGMLSLAGKITAGESSPKAIDYEICWRLGQWDMDVAGHTHVDTLNDMEKEFGKHHYIALQCLGKREENNSLAALANARQCVMAILREISVECLQSVYKYLTWLHMLQQVEDFCQIQFRTSSGGTSGGGGRTDPRHIFEKWQAECELQYGSFQCKEQVLSHQVALFRTAGIRASHHMSAFYKDANPIASCLLKCVAECRRAGKMNLAKRNIAALQALPIEQMTVKAAVQLEDADIAFRTGNPEITQAILQNVLRVSELRQSSQYVTAMRMYGEYSIESNIENFEAVLRKYFRPTLGDAGSAGEVIATTQSQTGHKLVVDEQNRRDSCAVVAKYADKEYVQLNAFTGSEEFQMKRRLIEQNRQTAESVGRQNKDRDKGISALQMKRFATLDEKEVRGIEQKRTDNLCIALQHYMRFCCLDNSDASTAAIYRIIALWFANQHNEEAHAIVAEHIAAVPSYKFICALNQMTARLNSQNEPFLAVLCELLIRCTRDHPQQALLHLLPLVFANADSSSKPTAAAAAKSNKRIGTAKEIIRKATTPANAETIKQLVLLFPALIDFANVEVGRGEQPALSSRLRQLKDLSAIHCPTMELPVSPSADYKITGIVKWTNEVRLVGGINAPKKLMCLCADGKRRPQLLKGRDDMRQDAVMQQLFGMINQMLAAEPEAVERRLQLRTYKVVPLSQRSGLLQWCENAIPIGVYLGGTGANNTDGAHQRYHPADYTVHKCRLLASQHAKSEHAKRHQIFHYICQRLTPAFHYFLLEKFPVPGVWFERRLAYTNSVATTSMVGFILGLGDRHAQNILIDEKTAEVIHIDFGIAFEQGRIMPTPETVPFRLTRDMVAPMGVCETNGVFRQSCESTMRVLRRHRPVITTILEVLLYDPLYMWNVLPQFTVTDSGGNNNNNNNNNNNDDDNSNSSSSDKAGGGPNAMAQRALLCVENKLEGRQAGALGTSEVHVQVQRLINEAISSVNLCAMFHGWDPYL